MALIPETAHEVVNETHENGAKMRVSYFVDGREIGWRFWGDSGIVLMEYQMRDGRRHGRYRHFHDNGVVWEEGSYEDDLEHGEVRQFDDTGRQIGSYLMNHGTGLDLWYESPGVLAEEHPLQDGRLHGFERWWSGDNLTVHEECHFWKGKRHGVLRRWNRHHKIARSYPQYYVMDERVTKRRYERACRADPTLPPYNAADNRPERPLPAVKGLVSATDLTTRFCSSCSPSASSP